MVCIIFIVHTMHDCCAQLKMGLPHAYLYLAVVLDLFARKVGGWAMAPDMQATLMCKALQLAFMAFFYKPVGVT